MPELPEAQTTASILNKKIKGLRILDVWTDYNSAFNKGKNNIKDKKYFYLGTYKTDIAAAYAYNKKAKSLSDFYCLNNLDFSETELENMLKNEVVIK